jgi:hypothetical protein
MPGDGLLRSGGYVCHVTSTGSILMADGVVSNPILELAHDELGRNPDR